MALIRILIIFLLAVFSANIVNAQSQKDGLSKDMPTENIHFGKEANRASTRPKRQKIEYIYKSSSEGLLYGNPCAMQATRKMGFEYVLQPPGIPGSPTQKESELNNFLVNLKLIFTKSPFWKLILNNRIKKCRQDSGDIVG